MPKSQLSIAVVAATAGLALSVAARAQSNWASAVDGNWNDPTKWDNGNVPDNGGETGSLGFNTAYTVEWVQTLTVGGITITNAKANLDVNPGVFLLVAGDIMNNGTIRINPDKSTTNAHLRYDASAALAGTGSLILSANQDDLDDAQLLTNGSTITQGSGHTIRGSGAIHAPLTNNGTIRADSAAQVLRVTDGTKTNNKLFIASGGGVLQIYNTTVSQGPNGIVRAANASTVSVASMGLNGGVIDTDGSGIVNIDGVSTFTSITGTATINVNPSTYLLINGTGFQNDGTITINPNKSSTNAHMRFDGDGVLGGAGSLLLRANQDDLDDAQLLTNGSTITHGANHLIHGSGSVHAPMINNGTIRADSSGEVLRVQDGTKTNNALMAASGGGILQLLGTTINQGPNGLVLAQDGSRVSIYSMGLNGGTIETEGSGVVTIDSNSTFTSIASTAAIEVNPNTYLLINGTGFQNDGTTTINPNKSSTNAHMRFDADGALSGAGSLLLRANQDDLDDAQLLTNGSTMTHGPDHLIHGSGSVHAPMINNGTILADSAGEVLRVMDGTKTNNALMAATGGGILQLFGTTINQGPGGLVLAEDASAISIVSMGLSGGVIDTDGSGLVNIDSNSTFTGVTSTGVINVNPNTFLLINGGMTNDGVIYINPGRSPSNAHMRIDTSDPIGGAGEIILRANNDDLGDAQLLSNGSQLILGPDQTLRGTGQINAPTTNNGTLAPGESIGRFQVNGSITLGGTSILEAEVAGPDAGQFDTIGVSGTAVLGGDLNVSLLDGYVPGPCAKFTLLTAGSVQGDFDAINGDAGNGRVWRAVYFNNRVDIVVTCYADMQPDCALDLFDFLAFTNYFNAGDRVADCIPDGVLDLFDFLCFVNAFNKGC